MSDTTGTRTFQGSGDAYDAFMGRYSRELAPEFGDYTLPSPGGRFLDVGCGPGALTSVAVARLGASAVAAVDPVPHFVEACRARHTGVDVRQAPAEQLPFDDGEFDAAGAQLVFHFVSDPARAVAEMARVVRPGGVVAATVWDFAEGMQMLRAFWDAALSVDPQAPDEARVMRFGAPGQLAGLFGDAGLSQVDKTTMSVASQYRDFDELWTSLLAGIGPAGAYAVALPEDTRADLRRALHEQLGSPAGPFTLTALARAARATVP